MKRLYNTTLLCISCNEIFDRRISDVPLIYYEKDNSVQLNGIKLECPHCGSKELMFYTKK